MSGRGSNCSWQLVKGSRQGRTLFCGVSMATKHKWLDLGDRIVRLSGLRQFRKGEHQYTKTGRNWYQIQLSYAGAEPWVYLDYETAEERDRDLEIIKRKLAVDGEFIKSAEVEE